MWRFLFPFLFLVIVQSTLAFVILVYVVSLRFKIINVLLHSIMGSANRCRRNRDIRLLLFLMIFNFCIRLLAKPCSKDGVTLRICLHYYLLVLYLLWLGIYIKILTMCMNAYAYFNNIKWGKFDNFLYLFQLSSWQTARKIKSFF